MGRRNNGLDFSHTCPRIDKAISEVKNQIESYLSDYIGELCPLLPSFKVVELSRKWGEEMYNEISPAFESVRETNEDMRKAADEQISNLIDDIEDLRHQMENLKYQAERA